MNWSPRNQSRKIAIDSLSGIWSKENLPPCCLRSAICRFEGRPPILSRVWQSPLVCIWWPGHGESWQAEVSWSSVISTYIERQENVLTANPPCWPLCTPLRCRIIDAFRQWPMWMQECGRVSNLEGEGFGWRALDCWTWLEVALELDALRVF